MSERGPKPGVNIELDYDPAVIQIANAVDAISLQRSSNNENMIERTKPLNLEVHQAFARYVETARPHLPNYYVLVDNKKAEAKKTMRGIGINQPSKTYFIPESFEIYEVRGDDDLWMQYGFNQILNMPIPDNPNERFEERDLPEQYLSLDDFKEKRAGEYTYGEFTKLEPHQSNKYTVPYPIWDSTSFEAGIVNAIEREIAQTQTTNDNLSLERKVFDQAIQALHGAGSDLEKEGEQKIKNRIINFINVFAANYSVPDILTLQDPNSRRGKEELKIDEMLGSEPKARDFQHIYLLIPEKRLVTGRLDRGILKIRSPRVINAQDLPEEGWNRFDISIIYKLIRLVPGLEEQLDEIRRAEEYN